MYNRQGSRYSQDIQQARAHQNRPIDIEIMANLKSFHIKLSLSLSLL